MTTRKTRSSAKKKKAPVAVAGTDNAGAPDGNVDASAGANLVIAKVTQLHFLAAGTCDRMLAGLSRLISEQHRSPDLLDVGGTIHGLSSAGEGGGNVDVADLDQLRRFVQRVLENVTTDDMLDAITVAVVASVTEKGEGMDFVGGDDKPHRLTEKKATKTIAPKTALKTIKELLGVEGHGIGHYNPLGSYDPATHDPGAAFLPPGGGVLDWARCGGAASPTDAKNVRARALLFAAYVQDECPQKDPTPARGRRGGGDGVTFAPKGGSEDEYDEDDEDEDDDDDEGGDGGNGGKGRARAAAGKAGAAAAGAATAGARRTTRRSSSSTAAASKNSTSALKTKSGPGGTAKKKAPKKQASSSSARRANSRGHGGDSAHARARSVSESPNPRRSSTVTAEYEELVADLATLTKTTKEANKRREEREARAQFEYARIDDLGEKVHGLQEDVDGWDEELQAHKQETALQVDNLQAQLNNQGDEFQAQLDNQQDQLADANTRSDAAAKAAAASAAVAGQASARSRIANCLARKGGKGNNGTNANPEESNRQANNGTNTNTANAGDAPRNADAAQRPSLFRTRLGNAMAGGLAMFAGLLAGGYPLEGAISGGLGAGTFLYHAGWLIRRSRIYRIFAIFGLASILLGYGFGILVGVLYFIMCLLCGI